MRQNSPTLDMDDKERLEPNIRTSGPNAVYTSAAISLKRIADHLCGENEKEIQRLRDLVAFANDEF